MRVKEKKNIGKCKITDRKREREGHTKALRKDCVEEIRREKASRITSFCFVEKLSTFLLSLSGLGLGLDLPRMPRG
jgi:hypothetical protein